MKEMKRKINNKKSFNLQNNFSKYKKNYKVKLKFMKKTII